MTYGADDHIPVYNPDCMTRLTELHNEGHRSQHWFSLHQKGTDKYVTFILYEKDKQGVSYKGTGMTFTVALVDCLEDWDAEHKT